MQHIEQDLVVLPLGLQRYRPWLRYAQGRVINTQSFDVAD
jgi:hypothetical protein